MTVIHIFVSPQVFRLLGQTTDRTLPTGAGDSRNHSVIIGVLDNKTDQVNCNTVHLYTGKDESDKYTQYCKGWHVV